jgi:hypothetical protein
MVTLWLEACALVAVEAESAAPVLNKKQLVFDLKKKKTMAMMKQSI